MKKILVVEGAIPIEGLSGALFRRRECVLEVASTGTEALGVAEEASPSLVIYDAAVDDFSPEDFIQALQSAEGSEETPVIVALPEAEPDREGRLLRGGAAAVLTRPVNGIDLNVKVCELLGISLRRHVRTFVKIKADAMIGRTTHFATISDISLGGVRLETDRKLGVGEFIRLQFFLPGDDEDVTVIGRIVRGGETDGAGAYGCQFLDLTDAARERVHDFITAATPD